METNKRFLIGMKILVNTIAFIAFIVQFPSFVFNAFTMKEPGTTMESLYNDFIFISFLCSGIIVLVFILLYNFRCKFLAYKVSRFFFIVIAVLAAYAHLWQLFVQKDLILMSSVLLLIDCYVVCKALGNK